MNRLANILFRESPVRKPAISRPVPYRPSFVPISESATVRRQPACPCGGGCPRCRASVADAESGPALELGAVDDPAEREADAMADAILAGRPHGTPSRFGGTPVQAKGIGGGPCPSSGGEEEESDQETPRVQAKPDGGTRQTGAAGLPARIAARRGGGEPLPTAMARTFEGHLGLGLAGVRLHRDTEAGAMARSIGALAFTTGNDVYFAPGQFAPETLQGTHLLAHELTHVAQQGAGPDDGPIRRFTLDGFTAAKEAQMRAAIASAKTKMLDCGGKGIPVHDISDIVRGLDEADYVFEQDLDDCGQSNPLTDTIKIGPSAFNQSQCCDLDSTLAHECAHSFAWSFECFARKVECKCFGCSCNHVC